MSEVGEQKLSLERLAVGIPVLCLLVTALRSVSGEAPFPYLFGSVGLAVVINIAARPNLAVASSVLMVVASFFLYVLASNVAPRLGGLGTGSVVAMAGFAGGTLFAMAAHALLFERPDPAMSLFVGALTVPSGLVFTFERRPFVADYGNGLLLFHLAWYVLFGIGLGIDAALRGRTVGSRP